MFRLVLGATTIVSLALFAAMPSQAQVTGGKVWINDTSANADACNSCGALVGGLYQGAPTSTFTTSQINYDSNVGGYTVGGFVNDPTGLHFSNPAAASDPLNNTHYQFVGTIGLLAGNNSFVVGHDDGLNLFISGIGTVVDAPGPTSFTNTPFNVFNPGAAGNFAFILQYNECCGPPAELLLQINGVTVSGVPEPGTWAMMLLGFVGLGFAFRQSRRKLSVA
jgi:PEP-CTERM motif